MSFNIPSGWKELSQEQFRFVMRMMWIYDDTEEWMDNVMAAVLVHFCNIEVLKEADGGLMCRERKNGKFFLLDQEILPVLREKVAWVAETDSLTTRIEKVGEYDAVDFLLQDLPFGEYLKAENWYQSYLLGKEERCLAGLAKVLYRIPEDMIVPELQEEVLLSVFLWYNAAKQELGRQFPNFLKLPGEQGETVTRKSLIDGMRAQIRLLTKGDVTKEQYVRDNVDTWTAMAELDALAKEAEEIKQKYGKG